MFAIRHVRESDRAFWFKLDPHLPEREFDAKVREGRGYIVCDGDTPVGVMRYNLFWDSIPFLTLIVLQETSRGRGLGRKAVLHWEREMWSLGYKMVLTSTQVDEQAQHFYRRLGYRDRGGLFLDGTPCEQPPELFLLKVLCERENTPS